MAAKYVEEDPLLLELKASRITIYGARNGFKFLKDDSKNKTDCQQVRKPTGLPGAIRHRVWQIDPEHPLAASLDQKTLEKKHVEYEVKLRHGNGPNKPLK